MTETRKVLICSSDPRLSAVFASESANHKYNVIEVRDTSILIQRVYDEMPHIIVVDLHPSDIGAFDICGQMKIDVILCHIPLVVVTDSTKVGSKIDCGADLYLSKPVDDNELRYHADRIVSQTIDELDINPLTHMHGNRSTVRRMEMAVADKKSFAVCCLDLKNLHVYNEAYGVHRGDFLIRETANILREVAALSAPGEVFIGHLGGDDFIVLTSPDASAPFAEKVIEYFDKSIHKFYERIDRERGYMVVKGHDGRYQHHSFVCLSIAIITNDLIAYERVAEITRTASQIQNYLKRFPSSAYLRDRRSDTRQPISLMDMSPVAVKKFNTEQVMKERQISKQSELMAAVARFLKTEDIQTYCQPIVNMIGREPHGYEALSRFQMPTGVFLDPGLVFHAAREANVIREFDVLCAKRAVISNEGLPREKKIFINLNRETLITPSCLEEIMKHSHVSLDQIVIELTEQSLLTEIDQIMVAVGTLRKKGVSFAIDDMGGGSVSLREAAALRPDYIKFDGSLIRDINSNEIKQKILLSLCVFAKGINAKTTAEGIETKAEMDYLEKTGIDFGQGFFIARPAKIHFASV